jgi:hypothetical protein
VSGEARLTPGLGHLHRISIRCARKYLVAFNHSEELLAKCNLPRVIVSVPAIKLPFAKARSLLW